MENLANDAAPPTEGQPDEDVNDLLTRLANPAASADSASTDDQVDGLAEAEPSNTIPTATPRRSREPAKPALVGLSLDQVETLCQELGQPTYRARQIYDWVFREIAPSVDSMLSLPKALRTQLATRVDVTAVRPIAEAVSRDGQTTKVLFELHDGATVESVLMDYDPVEGRTRHTVCVSSQAGCAVKCPFCATGQNGFTRNLLTAEIVDQVLFFARRRRAAGVVDDSDEYPITNIVFMGQGEPFANFDAVWKAVEILNSPYGFRLGARHMTISTAGIAPRILELAQKPLQVGLAISLHAPNDALRDVLVPLNKKWPIAELLSACRAYIETTNRRVTFEYVLLDGVNDSVELARELAAQLAGLLCHVNLIPMNPTDDADYRAPDRRRIVAFQTELLQRGIVATVRVERGVDIDAACGQLRVRVTRDESWPSAAKSARERISSARPVENSVTSPENLPIESDQTEPTSRSPRMFKPAAPGRRMVIVPRRAAATFDAVAETNEAITEETADIEPTSPEPTFDAGVDWPRRPAAPGGQPYTRPAFNEPRGDRPTGDRPWRDAPRPGPRGEGGRPFGPPPEGGQRRGGPERFERGGPPPPRPAPGGFHNERPQFERRDRPYGGEGRPFERRDRPYGGEGRPFERRDRPSGGPSGGRPGGFGDPRRDRPYGDRPPGQSRFGPPPFASERDRPTGGYHRRPTGDEGAGGERRFGPRPYGGPPGQGRPAGRFGGPGGGFQRPGGPPRPRPGFGPRPGPGGGQFRDDSAGGRPGRPGETRFRPSGFGGGPARFDRPTGGSGRGGFYEEQSRGQGRPGGPPREGGGFGPRPGGPGGPRPGRFGGPRPPFRGPQSGGGRFERDEDPRRGFRDRGPRR